MRIPKSARRPKATTADNVRGLSRLAHELFVRHIQVRSLLAVEEKRLHQEIWGQKESGMTVTEIAGRLDVTENYVRKAIQQWRRREGITVRGSAFRP